jgi:hypothetical protein
LIKTLKYGIVVDLDFIGKSLVELGNLVSDGQVNGTVTDLDDETTKNVSVDSVSDLKGLTLTNKRRLGDRGGETVNGLVVERRGRGDGGLNNAVSSVGQSLKLLNDGRNKRKSVVLSQEGEEVSDGVVGLDSGG